MTSSPDKQFRDSLEHYKKSPPPQAWSRIETGLHKNRNRSIWYSAAAAVILLIGATFIMLRTNESQAANPLMAIEQNNTTESTNQQPGPSIISEPISLPTESAPVIQDWFSKSKSFEKSNSSYSGRKLSIVYCFK